MIIVRTNGAHVFPFKEKPYGIQPALKFPDSLISDEQGGRTYEDLIRNVES